MLITPRFFCLSLSLLLILALNACRRTEDLGATGPLRFSLDTLSFDTVFTDMGTATRRFKVYNPSASSIRIDEIRLYGGSQSDFRLNIDGRAGFVAENLEIPARDSIYVFATVRIDPSNGDALRWDSIGFRTQTGEQKVYLSAYGWNAQYIGQIGFLTRVTNARIRLTAGRPYVLFGILAIDSASVLEIEPGVELFMYGGPSARPLDRALIYIGDNSTLLCGLGGDASRRVELKTHRLEEDFQALPFHHGGIFLSALSRGNRIHHTIIRNALDGIFVDSLSIDNAPKLELRQVLIYNVERSGLLGRQASIDAENVLIANSNNFILALLRGGAMAFRHCTFVNLATSVFVRRNEAVLSLRDFEVQIDASGREFEASAGGQISFENCVIFGSMREEVEVFRSRQNPVNLAFSFDHCLLKVDTFNQNIVASLRNLDPQFAEPAEQNYAPASESSPLVNAGRFLGVILDIQGRNRGPQPAIGAYELD